MAEPDFEKARQEAAQQGMPEDFGFTDLNVAVTQSNEVFEAHLGAGFSPRQALFLTAVMLTNNPGIAPPAH